MTTDITELAQREKFEAWVMTQICISKSTLEGLRTADGYRNSTLSGTDYNRLWSLYQSAASEQVEALEKAHRANAAQGDHINQQQDRIDILERRNAELGGELSRYSMSPGQADQRMCESRAARDALGFGKDADDVAPINLRERIDGMKARIAELEREQEHLRPVGVMSEQAFHRLENRECRFIALWPRPGIFLPRKRPEDGVIVYARTAAAAGVNVEAE